MLTLIEFTELLALNVESPIPKSLNLIPMQGILWDKMAPSYFLFRKRLLISKKYRCQLFTENVQLGTEFIQANTIIKNYFWFRFS